MPITFGELVQEVINEVRERERIQQIAQQQAVRIKELESEVAALKKEKEEHKCLPKVTDAREPDKSKPVPQPLKEIK